MLSGFNYKYLCSFPCCVYIGLWAGYLLLFEWIEPKLNGHTKGIMIIITIMIRVMVMKKLISLPFFQSVPPSKKANSENLISQGIPQESNQHLAGRLIGL